MLCRKSWTGPTKEQEDYENPHKMTSSGLLVSMFLTNLWEIDCMRVEWGPDVLQYDLIIILVSTGDCVLNNLYNVH